jgi:L-ascorbate metabolism protein UlaG (beta-lactamase superfamily)
LPSCWTALIDPFGPLPGLAARGLRFDYPPTAGVAADVLLVTHEHADHNNVDGAEAEIDALLGTPGDPTVLLLAPPGA